MSVLEGEGRVPILYGSQSLPMPPYRTVYLSRPDLVGRYPSVVVTHGASGLTPSVKAACRRLARHGYVAVAPDLRRGSPFEPEAVPADRAFADLDDVVEALTSYWDEWVTPGRIAVVGLDEGGPLAARLAIGHGVPVALLGGLDTVDGHILESASVSVLALLSGETGAVKALRDGVGRGEWVRYGDVGDEFHDEGSPDFAAAAADDAYDRVIAFLDRHLATPAAA